MKTYKQLISEVAQPKPEDEIDFKAKHEVEFIDHPESEETQHTANDTKKAKRLADYDEHEDMEVYESSDEVEMMMGQLEFIKYACEEIAEFIGSGIDPEEWFQNKLTASHTMIQGLHSYMEGKRRMASKSTDMDYENQSGYYREADEKMTDAQMKRREEIVMGMKKNQDDLKKRYGDSWKSVMYATANKKAMEESLETTIYEKNLDKVNPNALKKDFKDRSDKDIDNDGEVDDQDKYLHNRRKTITKAIAKESVDLDEAAQPKWLVSVRKSFGAGGVSVKKGDSVEVTARNTSEAIDKALTKMGVAKKDASGIAGSNFDLKKINESVDLEEAVKAGNVKLNDGTRANVSKDDAEALNDLFDQLSPVNKKKMEETMLKNKKGFDEILNFAREAM